MSAEYNLSGAAYRITAEKAMEETGTTLEDLSDSVIPACCSEGCMVEPDGYCEHDNPSVLVDMGMI